MSENKLFYPGNAKKRPLLETGKQNGNILNPPLMQDFGGLGKTNAKGLHKSGLAIRKPK